MMEISDVRSGCRPAAGVASAWNALCRLSTTDPWLWLVRPGAPGGIAAKAEETGTHALGPAPAVGLVLLDGLPRLLGAFGAEVAGHG